MVDPLEDVALRKADRPTTAACATWVSAALVALRRGGTGLRRHVWNDAASRCASDGRDTSPSVDVRRRYSYLSCRGRRRRLQRARGELESASERARASERERDGWKEGSREFECLGVSELVREIAR